MRSLFTKEQKKLISGFFSNVAVAWFIAIFVVPRLGSEFDTLTVIRFIGNMIGSLILALLYVQEEV